MTAGPPTDVPTSFDDWGGVPALVLRPDGTEIALKPWTACWGNGCYDGAPGLAGELDDVGSPDVVPIWSPEPDMRWEVTFVERGSGPCHRSIGYRASPTDGHNLVLEPAGPAGRYRVDVFGRAPSGGDVAYSFLWTTPTDGRNPPAASGVAAILADHDGELDSYGVELSISDLAAHPRTASARITVSSHDGRSVVLDPVGPGRCDTAGELSFRLGDGSAATEIGAGPFTYRVDLTLDGTTYVGSAVYPRDVVRGNAPNVRLRWEPPLPSYDVGESD